MTAFDYAVLVIVGLSVILSVWRGAVREIMALASWIAAFLAGQAFGGVVAAYIPATAMDASLRLLGGFVAVFLAVLLIASLLAHIVSRLVKSIGLGPVDRGLGAIFGLVRGILVVLTLVLLCGLTGVPNLPVWREAMLSPPLEAAVASVRTFLPDELSRRISYE